MAEEDIAWLTVVRDGAQVRVQLGRRRPSKAEDYVVHLLSAAILRDMEPGDLLPSQEDIGTALGISRLPVGRAMATLRDTGFVTGGPGAQWRVARRPAEQGGEQGETPGES